MKTMMNFKTVSEDIKALLFFFFLGGHNPDTLDLNMDRQSMNCQFRFLIKKLTQSRKLKFIRLPNSTRDKRIVNIKAKRCMSSRCYPLIHFNLSSP